MFKCEITGKMSKPGEKINKVVVETREKIYYGWRLNPEIEKMEYVVVGKGSEIVKEINASAEGVAELNRMLEATSTLTS